ncbi:hypothetical protein HPB47_019318 [Ixodes persulcatus]|uniref:Uncharacterized protein n=1 Tax=Ixodes persulcatus TaxID=34615 RepID=A0AC60QIH7_IXOPE|nr:hypothetical protein HPB47_019318 [Ixodes persulcatus]
MEDDGRPNRRKRYIEKGAEYVVPKSTLHYQKTARMSTSAPSPASSPNLSPELTRRSTSSPDTPQQGTPASDGELTASDEEQQWGGEDVHLLSDFEGSMSEDNNPSEDGPFTSEDDTFASEGRCPRDFVSVTTEDELMEKCFAQFGTSTLPHSSTTTACAVAMLMSLVHAHNFTWTALDDILKVVNKMFGQEEDVLPGTKYLFRKLWARKTSAVSKKFFYCENQNCTGLLEPDQSGKLTCAMCQASADGDAALKAGSFFTILNVREQVKHVISKTKQALSEHLTLLETLPDSPDVKDITSGSAYRSLKETGVLKTGDLTLTVNTDGSPVFKSSNSSIWPIQFTVSELPPEKRFSNTTLAGLWCGKKHPNMLQFMSKFADVLMDVEPIEWTCGAVNHTSKVHLLCCCADAPARAAVQNHVLYSGYFGCPWCLIRGEHTGGCIRYIQEDPEPAERTAESVARDAKLAERFREPVEGVKGASALAGVPNFDPVWGYSVDYMHCALLGVTRQITELLVASSNSECQFYIGKPAVLGVVNQRLLKIKPPHCITRLPRSLLERAFWKASEWRLWLLFYCLPCTLGVLHPRFWRHLARLAEAVHLLLRMEISPSQINRAETLLKKFVAQVPILYGQAAMTFNVHQLLHLANTVRRMGPLWANSAFTFESGNGQLLRHVTAAKGVPGQVIERAMMAQELDLVLSHQLLPQDTKVFCKKMLGYAHIKEASYTPGACLLGSPKPGLDFSQDEVTALQETLSFCPSPVMEHERLILAGQLCHSMKYTRAKRRNSSIIQCKDGRFGGIWRVLYLQDEDECVILCKELVRKESSLRFPGHIVEMVMMPEDIFMAVKPDDVAQVCLEVNFVQDGALYVCLLPNSIERD